MKEWQMEPGQLEICDRILRAHSMQLSFGDLRKLAAEAARMHRIIETIRTECVDLKRRAEDAEAALTSCAKAMQAEYNVSISVWVGRGPGGHYKDALRKANELIEPADDRALLAKQCDLARDVETEVSRRLRVERQQWRSRMGLSTNSLEVAAKICEDEICACCWTGDALAAAEHIAMKIREQME